MVSMADIVVSNIRELNRQLAAIEPQLKRQLVKDAKEFAKPVQQTVKSAIPTINQLPLSGMTGSGRMGANGGVKLGKVTTRFRASGSRNSAITSLVSVRVESPLIAMLEFAGKKNLVRRNRTRPYPYKGGTRTHAVTTQGKEMIARLSGKPARYAWPAAEKGIPMAERNILLSLNKASKLISDRLK